jgi:hypothetical protein
MDAALDASREVGMRYTGSWLLGLLAQITREPAQREAALAQGEQLLRQGCVSHCYFHFYENAVEAALAMGAWDEAERYVRGLEDYTRAEPLAWSDFFIRRGRALARCGRGERAAAIESDLLGLAAEARRLGLLIALPRIEAALGRAL